MEFRDLARFLKPGGPAFGSHHWGLAPQCTTWCWRESPLHAMGVRWFFFQILYAKYCI